MGTHQFEHDLLLRPAALAEPRTKFEQWLSEREADEETVSDLAVVLSELGANAINASGGDDLIGQIRAWCDGEEIVLEVENDPLSRSDTVVIHTDSDPLRGRGQGLGIVAAFTDSLEILPPGDDTGLIVRCRRRVPGLRC